MTDFLNWLDQWFEINVNPVNWAVMWTVAFICAFIAMGFGFHSWMEHRRLKRAPDRTAMARWMFREALFMMLGCGFAAGGGWSAVITNPTAARNGLFIGGFWIALNLACNLIDRWRVMQLGDEQERKERAALRSCTCGSLKETVK